MPNTTGAAHKSRGLMSRAALALLAATAWTGVAQAQSVAHTSAISSADGSHPFNAAAFNRVPQNLAASGYVEQEYSMNGVALAYAYKNPNTATDDSYAPVQTSPVPYVTRIIVRRPANPANFSGNVIVEILNDALGTDALVTWPFASNQFIANGDAYVGITGTPTGLAALKGYAPTRYRSLNWPSVAATRSACGTTAEPGLIYDQVTQLGTLLKTPSSTGPLPGFAVKALYLTGYSQGASTLLTYNRVFGQNGPLLNGAPLWDAYFVAAGGFRATLQSCEASNVSTLHNAPPASSISAVFQTQTVSEEEGAYLLGIQKTGTPVTIPAGTDSDASNNRYRYYDLAGAAHVNGDLARNEPKLADYANINALAYVTQAEATSTCQQPSGSIITAFPDRFVYDALWANLEAWVRNGTAPPHEAGKLSIPSDGLTGVPTNGVRSPAVDVPIDRYFGGTVVNNNSPGVATLCGLTGYQEPSGATTTTAAYNAAVQADAASLLAGRFMTAADAATLTATPSLAATYPDGTTSIPND